MSSFYEVKLEVESVKGYCAAGHKKGDTIIIRGSAIDRSKTNCDLCLYALSAFMPYITPYSRETDENDWINMINKLQCPDIENTVIFNLSRKKIEE
ncbi:MAG TPA: TIGR04076 family protein [Halobacteria archaeon]|jgi:uncharacterized repeat protein (TIGR04076 family)|nr:TIGR04076 family protein [Halobacteria archaeon]